MKKHGLYIILCLWISLGVMAADPQRDPTRPPVHSVGSDKYGLKVQSIIYSPTRKVATVNGKMVVEGDIVSTVEVSKIDKDKVTFIGASGSFSVPLYYNIKQVVKK